MRDKIRAAINETASCIHDATQWDDAYYANKEGVTLMDQLIDRIVDIVVNRRESQNEIAVCAPSCRYCGSPLISSTLCLECDIG